MLGGRHWIVGTSDGFGYLRKIFIMPKIGKRGAFFGPKSIFLNFYLNLWARIFENSRCVFLSKTATRATVFNRSNIANINVPFDLRYQFLMLSFGNLLALWILTFQLRKEQFCFRVSFLPCSFISSSDYISVFILQ